MLCFDNNIDSNKVLTQSQPTDLVYHYREYE